VDARTSPQHVVAVLHVAHYYGAGRLVGLCEAILAKELKRGDRDDEGVCVAFVFVPAAFARYAFISCVCILCSYQLLLPALKYLPVTDFHYHQRKQIACSVLHLQHFTVPAKCTVFALRWHAIPV